MSRLSSAALLTMLILPMAFAPADAEAPEPPPFYAIRDARVVTGTGATLERATVLVADGLIEAVGTDLAIPGDAWVIEGEGLTVFPGLIDSLTTLGQKAKEEPERSSGGSPFGGGGPTIRGPEDRPATTPWVAAAENLNSEDKKLEQWREAGFTAAVSAPADGLFAGQAALINLGGRPHLEPADLVVATPVAQRMNLRATGGFRTFPGSLMGVLSYVKQVFEDADHHQRSHAVYAASPAGKQRPGFDRTLDPIVEARADGLPFLMPADLGRHVDRVLAIADEYDLEVVIYGAHGAYDRVETLAASGAAVLVSLEWPEEEKDRDPEADTPFRTLYHRRMAPTVPAKLAAAGVPFGFYSDGLTSPAKILEAVRGAVDAGLAPDAALAALTTGPARILGVEDRLGTVERGKIANLVVASDYPWAEGAEIAAVFVDGRKYQEREEEEEEGDPPAADVSGTWALVLTTPRGTSDITAELEMTEDGKVTGTLESERGEREVEKGKMSADLLTFRTTQTMGDRTMEASFSLTVEGEEISGSMSAGPMSMDLSGTRTSKPDEEGAEAGGGDEEEADEVAAEDYQRVMDLYQGPVRRMGSYAITNATVYTVSGEVIQNGTVVVRDGEIRAVGPASEVKMPRSAEVIDAGGGSLIPGIIDAHSHIAIEGGGNEGSLSVTSMVTIQDVLNPDDVSIYRALAGGVTVANILHGSANPIGGGNAVIKLRWGADADGLRFAGAPKGIKFALGENPKRARFRFPGVTPRYPATRMGVMDVIRQAFREAEDYRAEWQAYEAAGRRGMPPRRDFKLERLVEILEGERLVHSHCYRADEILQLLRLAEEFGFKIQTLQHVLEGYKIADEIAAHGAGASTFSDWWGYKIEAYDAIPHNAALMAERGVLVSINSDSGEEMRHLNQEAAKAIKWGGMSEAEALKLVTLNPAIQFGIDDRVGSIEVGKDADLVLYDGHPLKTSSIVQKTFVDGDLYFDREADRARQAAIDDIKKRILPDEEEETADGEEGEERSAEEDEPEGDEPGWHERPRVFWTDPHPFSCREEGR